MLVAIMGQAFQPYIGRMNLNAQSAIKVLLFFVVVVYGGGGGGGGEELLYKVGEGGEEWDD